MVASPGSVSVRAYAKINLGLRVLGSAGDGYHLVSSLMQLIDLHDTMTFQFRPGGASSSMVIQCDDPRVPSGDESGDNLITRALRSAGVSADVTVLLHKGIPVGAGLGGGSSDAAAALVVAARALKAPGQVDSVSPEELAFTLGADVPFFLEGGTREATGCGEVLRPLPFLGRFRVLLMCPPVHVSTADVYRAYDRLTPSPQTTPMTTADVTARLYRGEVLEALSGIHNDLQEPALRCHPELARWSDAFLRVVNRPVVMTGSGSCFYTLYGRDGEGCHDDMEALRSLESAGARVFAALFRSGRGWEFIENDS